MAVNWFGEMVRVFELTRSAAAKYCEGIALLKHPELSNRGVRCPSNGLSPAPAIPE